MDREAVTDPRERALFRAMAERATTLADAAETRSDPPRTGNYL